MSSLCPARKEKEEMLKVMHQGGERAAIFLGGMSHGTIEMLALLLGKRGFS